MLIKVYFHTNNNFLNKKCQKIKKNFFSCKTTNFFKRARFQLIFFFIKKSLIGIFINFNQKKKNRKTPTKISNNNNTKKKNKDCNFFIIKLSNKIFFKCKKIT